MTDWLTEKPSMHHIKDHLNTEQDNSFFFLDFFQIDFHAFINLGSTTAFPDHFFKVTQGFSF